MAQDSVSVDLIYSGNGISSRRIFPIVRNEESDTSNETVLFPHRPPNVRTCPNARATGRVKIREAANMMMMPLACLVYE
jgi:hypothetical protein